MGVPTRRYRRAPIARGVARQRRKRVWARTSFGLNYSAAAQSLDMLAALRTKLGAIPPGATVGGIRLSLYFDYNAAHTAVADDATIFVGILVGPDTLDADDISPLSNLFLDWMYWERFQTHVGATADTRVGVERQIRSMRKLEEAGDTLWLAVDGTLGAGPTVQSLNGGHSTILLMP